MKVARSRGQWFRSRETFLERAAHVDIYSFFILFKVQKLAAAREDPIPNELFIAMALGNAITNLRAGVLSWPDSTSQLTSRLFSPSMEKTVSLTDQCPGAAESSYAKPHPQAHFYHHFCSIALSPSLQCSRRHTQTSDFRIHRLQHQQDAYRLMEQRPRLFNHSTERWFGWPFALIPKFDDRFAKLDGKNCE